jgi:FkbM family methyltransferase
MSTVAERLDLVQVECGGFHWLIRPGSSDESVLDEVVRRRSYFTRAFHPEPGERWLDAGANIGTFAVLTTAAGATVTAYEPWPEHAELARRNLALNGLTARVREKAVALHRGTGRLGLSRSLWRHSLLKQRAEGLAVPVVAFEDAIAGMDGAKLDIEGAEIELLQAVEDFGHLHKLVFEWHFDYERSTDVYLDVLARLAEHFRYVNGRKVKPGTQYTFFPPSSLVRCSR